MDYGDLILQEKEEIFGVNGIKIIIKRSTVQLGCLSAEVGKRFVFIIRQQKQTERKQTPCRDKSAEEKGRKNESLFTQTPLQTF